MQIFLNKLQFLTKLLITNMYLDLKFRDCTIKCSLTILMLTLLNT